jgi:hypothetical protein
MKLGATANGIIITAQLQLCLHTGNIISKLGFANRQLLTGLGSQ